MSSPVNTQGVDIKGHSGDPIRIDAKNDLYDYGATVDALITFLQSCSTPFVVGVYGRWGRGKSTILDSLHDRLKNDAQQGSHYLHHRYSPWHYQLEGFNDVWISMISEFATKNDDIGGKLKKVIKEINVWNATKGALRAGATVIGLGDAAKDFLDSFQGDGGESNEYDQFLKAKRQFDEAIKTFRQNKKDGRVFFYIDDIDRCDPAVSVNVLRAIQVLCRTEGCIFVLGLDRDVIVRNLAKFYEDETFAREYLDKIVQLHIELPLLDPPHMERAICHKSDGSDREGVRPFAEWIASAMEFNPRKIERFVYLYNFKLLKRGDKNRDFHFYRHTVLFCVWELRWPSLTSEVAESREILHAMEELITAANEDMEVGIMKKYDHLPFVEVIRRDRGFLKSFKGIYDIKPEG